jgi:GDP-D-mannose 3', 5'-epimerase
MDTRAGLEAAAHVVLGGAGFIGAHLGAHLRDRHGAPTVIAVDKAPSPHRPTGDYCSEFIAVDLTDAEAVASVAQRLPHGAWVWHFAADMGGMGYLQHNDAVLATNMAITLAALRIARTIEAPRFFFASSACVYPEVSRARLVAALSHENLPPWSMQSCTQSKQMRATDGAAAVPDGASAAAMSRPTAPALAEEDAWPAQPQDGYGLEKLVAEKLAQFASSSVGSGSGIRQRMLARIARFHNVYGPYGTWIGGREKAPAAFLRKALAAQALAAARASTGGPVIEMWGDGTQQRSYLFIEDAVRGIVALMTTNAHGAEQPVNIGSTDAITVRQLAIAAGEAVGLTREDVERRLVCNAAGPRGVDDRNCDGTRAFTLLAWRPEVPLPDGLRRTGEWIRGEMHAVAKSASASAGAAFHQHALCSPHVAGGTLPTLPPRRFALLVPVTSRSEPPTATAATCTIATGIRNLLRSLGATVPSLSLATASR